MIDTKRQLTIKEWRKILNLSQADVADKLNIHLNTYREYEAHQDRIRIGTLIKFCNALGIKISEVKIFD